MKPVTSQISPAVSAAKALSDWLMVEFELIVVSDIQGQQLLNSLSEI